MGVVGPTGRLTVCPGRYVVPLMTMVTLQTGAGHVSAAGGGRVTGVVGEEKLVALTVKGAGAVMVGGLKSSEKMI